MQEVRSWVSSSLAHRVLLAMFKETKGYQNDFLKKYASLKEKSEFKTNDKLLINPDFYLLPFLKDENMQEVECPRDAALEWVNNHNYTNNNNLEKNVPATAPMVVLNFSSFESPWARSNGNSLMKIYNSFSYTQDVNYEARILVLPLQDEDFKLVVIAPNDVDLLHTLFRRLSHEGLQAAICNIQPLFTMESKLMPPVLNFTSEETFKEKLDRVGDVTISQCGTTNISENGAQLSVLSYLYIKPNQIHTLPKEDVSTVKKQPFFFALIYQDSPIFTGQFK